MALHIIKDNELERTYQLEDGCKITIIIDDLFENVSIKDMQGNEIGRIEFSEISDDFNTQHKITWMYLDRIDSSYKRKGIGRESLKFFKEITGTQIVASENDGIRKDDGSHLTGDAPAFVSKMQEEGIIERQTGYDPYDRY